MLIPIPPWRTLRTVARGLRPSGVDSFAVWNASVLGATAVAAAGFRGVSLLFGTMRPDFPARDAGNIMTLTTLTEEVGSPIHRRVDPQWPRWSARTPTGAVWTEGVRELRKKRPALTWRSGLVVPMYHGCLLRRVTKLKASRCPLPGRATGIAAGRRGPADATNGGRLRRWRYLSALQRVASVQG